MQSTQGIAVGTFLNMALPAFRNDATDRSPTSKHLPQSEQLDKSGSRRLLLLTGCLYSAGFIIQRISQTQLCILFPNEPRTSLGHVVRFSPVSPESRMKLPSACRVRSGCMRCVEATDPMGMSNWPRSQCLSEVTLQGIPLLGLSPTWLDSMMERLNHALHKPLKKGGITPSRSCLDRAVEPRFDTVSDDTTLILQQMLFRLVEPASSQ